MLLEEDYLRNNSLHCEIKFNSKETYTVLTYTGKFF